MNLELKSIYLDDVVNDPEDLYDFNVPINIEVCEKGKKRSELFHFVFSSPQRLQHDISESVFQFMHGYILLAKFDWRAIHHSMETLIDRARSGRNWKEVIAFLSRYGVYESKDLDKRPFPVNGAI
ncbi:MAG TPA: Imm8 family immunity protein [Pyrinomonadaceae bacterium]|jgi:tRNA splicing endonuclease|nr:Imm8 family immunity protein [Pyrinomonadaceae bacterium]